MADDELPLVDALAQALRRAQCYCSKRRVFKYPPVVDDKGVVVFVKCGHCRVLERYDAEKAK